MKEINTAIHEIGHCAMFFRAGRKFKSVQFNDHGVEANCAGFKFKPAAFVDQAPDVRLKRHISVIRNHIAILYGGYHAELICTDVSEAELKMVCSNDMRYVDIVMQAAIDNNLLTEREAPDFVLDTSLKALQYMRPLKNRIIVLAERLVLERKLDYETVVRVLR